MIGISLSYLKSDIEDGVLVKSMLEILDLRDDETSSYLLVDVINHHSLRINQSSKCSTKECCSCGDMETPGITNTFSGLNLLRGSKRKRLVKTDVQCDATPFSYENSANSDNLMKPKRARQICVGKICGCCDSDLEMCVIDGKVDSQADMNRLWGS